MSHPILAPSVLTLALSLAFPAFAATDDLARLKAEIAELKAAYEQRIAALESRLDQATSVSQTTVSASAARPAPASSGNAFNPEISLILQGQARQAKKTDGIGIGGFLAAPETRNKTRGFSVDESEIVLSASVDPYWRGQAILSASDGNTGVEEAWFQGTGLGNGIGLKAGRFLSGIGYLNEQHPHGWDFADAPLGYQVLFGKRGAYSQDGVQLKWLAPSDTFLEFGAEFGKGANFPGSERNKNGNGSAALFAHVGGDFGISHNWRAGISWLSTSARDRSDRLNDIGGTEVDALFSGKSRVWLADFVWKWAPNGNPNEHNFKFQSEYFRRSENGNLGCADATGASTVCPVANDDYRSRQSGWYAQGVYQFAPGWRAGYRYDRLESGTVNLGTTIAAALSPDNSALKKYSPTRHTLMADYSWSEFSRVRLQFARDRSLPGISDNQVTLQYIMSLGAHGAHKF